MDVKLSILFVMTEWTELSMRTRGRMEGRRNRRKEYHEGKEDREERETVKKGRKKGSACQ